MLRPVVRVAILKGNSPRLPAASLSAAVKGANGMNKLMMGISLPLDRLPPARNDHTGPVFWSPAFYLDGRGQMHQGRYGAEDALCVVDQADQLPYSRLAS